MVFFPAGHAETWVVTEASDSGAGSLRSAVIEASAKSGPHLILLENPGQFILGAPLPEISGEITLASTAQERPSLALVGHEPLLRVVSGSVTLSNLAFTGSSISNAPVISNAAVLRIENCVISSNASWQRFTNGGIVFSQGQIVITNSRFIGNRVTGMDGQLAWVWPYPSGAPAGRGMPGLGGAIHVAAGRAEIRNCEFRLNETQGGPGGYSSFLRGYESSGNSAGGAISITGGAEAAISECLFWKNTALGNVPAGVASGGALHVSHAKLDLHGSLFLENGAYGSSNYWTGKSPTSGGHAVGGAVHSFYSDARIRSSEFRLNWAANPPGVATLDAMARGGGVLVEGTPVFLQGNVIKENGARGARDLGGPVRSGGSNTIGEPGGAAGLSLLDNIPNPQVHARNPRFEWVQTGADTPKGFLASTNGGFYSLAGDSVLTLASFDRFASNDWSAVIGTGYAELHEFFRASNAVNMVLDAPGWFNVPGVALSFTGDILGTRRDNGEVRVSKLTPSAVPQKVAELGSAIYTLAGGVVGRQPLIATRERAGIASFTLSLGDAVYRNTYPQPWRKWLDVTEDALGNWFVSGWLETNFTHGGFRFPTNFVVSLSADNRIRWVVEPPGYSAWQRLHAMQGGLLICSSMTGDSSRWDFLDRTGTPVWSKVLPCEAFLQTSDPTRGMIYVASSSFLPGFQRVASGTYAGGEKIVYAFESDLDLQWVARIFGGVTLTSMILDTEGNLILGGHRGDDLTFHNNIVVRGWHYSMPAFTAKLNTRVDSPNPITVQWNGSGIELKWPSSVPAVLEHSSSLGSSAQWSRHPVGMRGNYIVAELQATNRSGFYRLIEK